MASDVVSYSVPQRVLHWLVVGLVFFNLLLPDGMEAWNRAIRQTGTATPEQVASANLHAYAGILILILTLCRIILLLTMKSPALPPEEPPIFRLAAKVVHGLLYVVVLALPFTGIGAYYFGNEQAGDVHGGPLKTLLWILIAAHVLGVLVHQFYWKTNVMRRMTVG
ncbi:cytochrome b [Pseudorhizobium sp. NPDC055634]